MKYFDIDFPSSIAAALTARTPATLIELTAMGFPLRPRSSDPLCWLLGKGGGTPKLAELGAGWLQYCPQCLDEDTEPYYRRIWRLVPVTCCIQHELVLLDECTSCRRFISPWSMSTSCPHCADPDDTRDVEDDGPRQLPYAAAPRIQASPLALAAQRILLGQLEIAGTANKREARLLSKFTRIISGMSSKASLERLPVDLRPIERHVLLAASARQIGVAGTEYRDLLEAHQAWLREVGRPLFRDSLARRSALRTALVESGPQRAKRSKHHAAAVTIAPATNSLFDLCHFENRTTAANTYWRLLLQQLRNEAAKLIIGN